MQGNSTRTFVACKNCVMFSITKDVLVQYQLGDKDKWQYCPNCGEEWNGKVINPDK